MKKKSCRGSQDAFYALRETHLALCNSKYTSFPFFYALNDKSTSHCERALKDEQDEAARLQETNASLEKEQAGKALHTLLAF